MSNEITTTTGIVDYNPTRASLKEMRADSQRFPRLNSLAKAEAVEGMTRIVSQAFLYKGQTADPTNIRFIASALVDELLEDTTHGAGFLSLGEIQVIVKRAVLSSDMFGISVSSLYKAIMTFVKGEGCINQREVDAQKKTRRDKRVQTSGLNPMIRAYTGDFLKTHTIK